MNIATDIPTLDGACARFNRSAKSAGLGRRVHCDSYGPASAWPWTVTQTDSGGRDHQTHGFHSERDAVAHVMDLATTLETYAARPDLRPAACQQWP